MDPASDAIWTGHDARHGLDRRHDSIEYVSLFLLRTEAVCLNDDE